MHQTSDSIVESGKGAFNTTIATSSEIAHGAADKTSEVATNVWDGTKTTTSDLTQGVSNVAAASAEKTGQVLAGNEGES